VPDAKGVPVVYLDVDISFADGDSVHEVPAGHDWELP
jgi:hypothetical protein